MILCVICWTPRLHFTVIFQKDLTRKQQEELIVLAESLAEANYEAAVDLSVIRDPRHLLTFHPCATLQLPGITLLPARLRCHSTGKQPARLC
jgi:hypothetical protein